MFKKKKNVFLIAGFVIVFIALVKIIPEIRYRSNIPSLPDLTNVNDSVRNQIKEASSKAYFNPSSDNLGMEWIRKRQRMSKFLSSSW